MTATTPPMPIAPTSSGTRRRPRDRMSNHNSTNTNGTITTSGIQNAEASRTRAAATRSDNSIASAASTRCATRVRGRTRRRRASTRTTFNGVRAVKATKAATPRHRPAPLHRSSNPRSTGSRVRPQPPCSVGNATDRSVERRPGAGGAPAPAMSPGWTVLLLIGRYSPWRGPRSTAPPLSRARSMPATGARVWPHQTRELRLHEHWSTEFVLPPSPYCIVRNYET